MLTESIRRFQYETWISDAVVVLGDFNTDLRKSGRFSKLLVSFLNNSTLIPVGLSNSKWPEICLHGIVLIFLRIREWTTSVVFISLFDSSSSDFEIRDGMSMCSDHWPIFWCSDMMR